VKFLIPIAVVIGGLLLASQVLYGTHVIQAPVPAPGSTAAAHPHPKVPRP